METTDSTAPLTSAIRSADNADPRAISRPKKIAVLFAGFVVALAALAWPFTRAHLQAAAVLRQVSGQPVPDIITGMVRVPVHTEEVQFQTTTGVVRGRLYLPQSRPDAPGLIVLHGVHYKGIDEPRLKDFATAMASCGLQVLTPELPGIKDYHIDSDSVKVIDESARWFAKRTGSPVGVMGLSFSGGLALVAATHPEYQPDFKFVIAVGSQDSMEHVANYYLTGRETRPDGTIEQLPPHEYGALVLEYEHLEDFVPERDEGAIRPVLRQHLYEDKIAEALAMERLDARQKAEAAQLIDSSSPQMKAMLAASTEKHLREMDALSPHGLLQTMTTPVYLLHGRADNIIPSAESMWMAGELPPSTLKEVLISPVLSHLDLDGSKPGIMDQWKIVHFFAVITHAAEKK
ncbi:MAG: alpha/beta hydrolase [Edaphobacter sp.]